jgi:hypothetical protein
MRGPSEWTEEEISETSWYIGVGFIFTLLLGFIGTVLGQGVRFNPTASAIFTIFYVYGVLGALRFAGKWAVPVGISAFCGPVLWLMYKVTVR